MKGELFYLIAKWLLNFLSVGKIKIYYFSQKMTAHWWNSKKYHITYSLGGRRNRYSLSKMKLSVRIFDHHWENNFLNTMSEKFSLKASEIRYNLYSYFFSSLESLWTIFSLEHLLLGIQLESQFELFGLSQLIVRLDKTKLMVASAS